MHRADPHLRRSRCFYRAYRRCAEEFAYAIKALQEYRQGRLVCLCLARRSDLVSVRLSLDGHRADGRQHAKHATINLQPRSAAALAYSLYHSKAARHRFAFRFDEASAPTREGRQTGSANLAAPPQLKAEMRSLIQFKSAALTDLGFQRSGVWGPETAAQRGEHLALLFGALNANSNR